MGTLEWSVVAVFGLIDIFLQFTMPDLIPDAIKSAFVTNSSQFIGYNALLQIILFLYLFGGYIAFIGGIFMALRSHSKSKSN